MPLPVVQPTPAGASVSQPEPAGPPVSQPDLAVASSVRPQRELVLYKFDSCPYCRRVMRVIDQLELAGSIEYRDTRTDPKWRSDLQQRTGRTQVPCLFIDGEAMFESADINEWLQHNYA